MRTKRTDLLILAAMTIAVMTLAAADVAAAVRVSATVRTPVVTVHVGNVPVGHRVIRQVRPLPARGRFSRILTLDVQVAHRLAWYTGVQSGELLRYRRFGYSWYEIGRWLYVPGRVVRAAMTDRTWNLFLRQGGYYTGFYGGQVRRDRGDRHSEIYEYEFRR